MHREQHAGISLEEVRETIKTAFSSHFGIELEKSAYNTEEKSAICELESGKYLNREWIYQKVDVPDLAGEAKKMTQIFTQVHENNQIVCEGVFRLFGLKLIEVPDPLKYRTLLRVF